MFVLNLKSTDTIEIPFQFIFIGMYSVRLIDS